MAMDTMELLRGLSAEDCISEGCVTNAAFQFKPSLTRNDSFSEVSINWHDDYNAKEVLFSQQKKDSNELQFGFGIAIIDIREMKRLLHNHIQDGRFSYERNILPENEYHGNLLLKSDTPKTLKHQIMHGLALLVKQTIPNPYRKDNT